ncbi:cytochrome c oxidase subunit II [Aurantimonas marianensis]|uniref:Cytochrome aa3 subunit 2 n=1 Tax=Aurantimonas marianensis TaxID=2920428 RepID=A0A9X2HBV0_9HYPH|nr:cytochrome c oxidase subunit II [Aurantimonas marianensis]MCP3054074.1 cytochrome c oxidase subunit II [Aurantimonas marianensis]
MPESRPTTGRPQRTAKLAAPSRIATMRGWARSVSPGFLPVLAAGCAGPQSAFDGAGTEAASVETLFWIMLAGAVVIWLLVIGLSVYATRANPAAHSEATGIRLIIWGGAVVPTIVLAALLVWGLAMMPDLRREADGPKIAVSGERFWWRIAYGIEGEPGVAKSLPAGGVESANELWLPVGRRSEILLGSPDVIHSFWVPAIAGKTDAIPGRVNRLVLEPTREGVYNGVCAEFCGDAHAQMGFRVVVVSEADYARYVEIQARPAAVTEGEGAARFLERGCGACHTVRGTPADGAVGPDLTHIASRRTIGAGLLETTPANIAAFIRSPTHVKPGAEMPAFAMLPEAEITAIADWLGALR